MMGVEPDLQFVYVLKNKGKTPAFGKAFVKVPLSFPWFALYILHRLDAGAGFFYLLEPLYCGVALLCRETLRQAAVLLFEFVKIMYNKLRKLKRA